MLNKMGEKSSSRSEKYKIFRKPNKRLRKRFLIKILLAFAEIFSQAFAQFAGLISKIVVASGT